jgi:Spy/CpxP family protein refolding chaperone
MKIVPVAVALAALAGWAQDAAAQGLPGKGGLLKKKNQKEETGPFGLPTLKTVEDKLALTPAQRTEVLKLYNEYRRKEQDLKQDAKDGAKTGPDALRKELVEAILKLLTAEQQPRFEELARPSKKK